MITRLLIKLHNFTSHQLNKRLEYFEWDDPWEDNFSQQDKDYFDWLEGKDC